LSGSLTQSRNRVTQSRAELLWSKRELTTKVGKNLGLSLCTVPQSIVTCVVAISGGLNCCQEFRRGVVYRLIGVRIEHVKDVNLRTKELGYN